jgi:hypothetical protein
MYDKVSLETPGGKDGTFAFLSRRRFCGADESRQGD